MNFLKLKKWKSSFLIFGFTLVIHSSNYGQDLPGTWQGLLSVFGTNIRVVFHFTKDGDNKYSATTDSPDQGQKGMDVDEVEVNGDSLFLAIYKLNGEYAAVYNKDSLAYIGNLKQRGIKFPLKIIKGEADDLLYKRPQKPNRPFPYEEEEVLIKNKTSGIELSGTFSKPKGKGKFPAVILITGSGKQDRDETVMGHKPFLLISDYLARRGFAVLRCDDRGAGKSTGDFSSSTSGDFSTDAEAQIDFLESRSDVDKKKIGLLGHSEGGLIAPMVAARRHDVAFVVMLEIGRAHV